MALNWITVRRTLHRRTIERAIVSPVERVEQECEKALTHKAAGAPVVEKFERRRYLDANWEPWDPGKGDWTYLDYELTWTIHVPVDSTS